MRSSSRCRAGNRNSLTMSEQPRPASRIDLAFSIDDSRPSMVRMVRAIRAVPGNRPADVLVDLTKCRYLGPYAAATLVAFVRALEKRGSRIQVTLPTQPKQLAAFCRFSGLDHLFADGPEPDDSHPDCETIPIIESTAQSWLMPDRLFRLIGKHETLDEETEDLFRMCLSEVLQNVVDHSESPIGSVSCARFLAGTSEIRAAVVDRGLGVGETLRRQHPGWDDQRCLRSILKGNVSSKSRRSNRGLGIRYLGDVVTGRAGSLLIISGSAYGERTERGNVVRALPDSARFSGTGVFFKMQIAPEDH